MFRHSGHSTAKGVNSVADNLRLSRRRGHEARELGESFDEDEQ